MSGSHRHTSATQQVGRSAVGLLIVWVLAGLLVLAACSSSNDEPGQVALSYAQGLETALRGESLDGVRPYATPDNIERVRLYVSKLNNDGELVEATLQEFDIDETAAGEAEGVWTVEVVERWTSVPVDDPQTEPEVYEQRVRYTLVTIEGELLVDEVEELGAP